MKPQVERGEKQQSKLKPEHGLIRLKPTAQATQPKNHNHKTTKNNQTAPTTHQQRNGNLAPPKGLEPLTDWLTASRSTGLSYGGKAQRLCHFGVPQKYLRLVFLKAPYNIRLTLYFANAAKPL